MRTSRVNEAFISVFPLRNSGGHLVSGEVQSDFIVYAFEDGAAITPTFTISEIDSTGFYAFSVPAGFSKGTYTFEIIHDHGPGSFSEVLEVRNHDADSLYGSLAGFNLNLTIDDGSSPLQGVSVTVCDSTDSTFITRGSTAADGTLTLVLPADSYTLRYFKAGYTFTSDSVTLSSDGQAHAVSGTGVSVEAPADPTLCRIYADFLTLDGQALANLRVNITNLYDPSASSGLAVAEAIETYTSNASGHVEFDVVQGARIRIALVSTNMTRDVTVPAQSTASLFTLLGQATDAFAVVPAS